MRIIYTIQYKYNISESQMYQGWNGSEKQGRADMKYKKAQGPIGYSDFKIKPPIIGVPIIKISDLREDMIDKQDKQDKQHKQIYGDSFKVYIKNVKVQPIKKRIGYFQISQEQQKFMNQEQPLPAQKQINAKQMYHPPTSREKCQLLQTDHYHNKRGRKKGVKIQLQGLEKNTNFQLQKRRISKKQKKQKQYVVIDLSDDDEMEDQIGNNNKMEQQIDENVVEIDQQKQQDKVIQIQDNNINEGQEQIELNKKIICQNKHNQINYQHILDNEPENQDNIAEAKQKWQKQLQQYSQRMNKGSSQPILAMKEKKKMDSKKHKLKEKQRKQQERMQKFLKKYVKQMQKNALQIQQQAQRKLRQSLSRYSYMSSPSYSSPSNFLLFGQINLCTYNLYELVMLFHEQNLLLREYYQVFKHGYGHQVDQNKIVKIYEDGLCNNSFQQYIFTVIDHRMLVQLLIKFRGAKFRLLQAPISRTAKMGELLRNCYQISFNQYAKMYDLFNIQHYRYWMPKSNQFIKNQDALRFQPDQVNFNDPSDPIHRILNKAKQIRSNL